MGDDTSQAITLSPGQIACISQPQSVNDNCLYDVFNELWGSIWQTRGHWVHLSTNHQQPQGNETRE